MGVSSQEGQEKSSRFRAFDVVVIGIFLFFLGIITLASNSCSPQCTPVSGTVLVVTFFGGIIVAFAGIVLGLYRVVSAKGSRIEVIRKGFRPKPTKRRLAIGASLIAVILILGYYGLVSTNRPEWVFNGAYANYSGSVAFNGLNYSGTIEFRVINYNGSAANTITYRDLKVGSSDYPYQMSRWVRLAGVVSPFETTNATKTFQTYVVIENESVSVTAYVYNSEGALVSQTTEFVNHCYGGLGKPLPSLPDEIEVSFSDGASLRLMLVNTNVPGLLPSMPLDLGAGAHCP